MGGRPPAGPRAVLLKRVGGALLCAVLAAGTRPHRVVRVDLDRTRRNVVGLAILVMNHPDFDEPTLGVVSGGDLYFIANSQYRRVGRDGTLDREHLRPPVVLRTRVAR